MSNLPLLTFNDVGKSIVGLTSVGQTGSTCHVKCIFMDESDKDVPTRSMDRHLK